MNKTKMLAKLFLLVQTGSNAICLNRPRRFGKTVMANMIAAFFGRSKDTSELFDQLKIAEEPQYHQHLNQYDVIFISFHELPQNCESYA